MKKTIIWIIVAVVVIGVVYYLYNRLSAPTVPGEEATTPAAGAEEESFAPCLGCLTETDKGTSVTETVGTTFTLELPKAKYDQGGITIKPAGILDLNSGATASGRDYWAQSFRAEKTGAVELTIPSLSSEQPDFKININLIANSAS